MKHLEGKLLVLCVHKGQSDIATRWAKAHGAKGATILFSRSFSSHSFLRMIGLGDMEMEMVLIEMEGIEDIKCSDFNEIPNISGFALSLGKREEEMSSQYSLITAIVNKGFADEVAEAARNAGSIGATVLNARGTGTADDVKLMSVTLVPEKDVVFLVCPAKISSEVITAIKGVKGLDTEGTGVVFENPVSEFYKLGSPS